jgi:hypothetical protein
VIRAWEVAPPAGGTALEWVLLTNVPVRTLADARMRVGWYEARWVTEEYHKVLKTGLGVEQLQLTSVTRLGPAIGVLSVAAVALLSLRDAGRDVATSRRPAHTLFGQRCVAVLSRWRYREVRVELSVHEFLYALARLGGRQNRKGDGAPGWLVLWRGWTKLQAMTEAASLIEDEKSG